MSIIPNPAHIFNGIQKIGSAPLLSVMIIVRDAYAQLL